MSRQQVLGLVAKPIVPLQRAPLSMDYTSSSGFKGDSKIKTVHAAERTLLLFQEAPHYKLSEAQYVKLRQRLRFAAKHVIEVLEAIENPNNEPVFGNRDRDALQRYSQLLQDIATELNTSVQHLQASAAA